MHLFGKAFYSFLHLGLLQLVLESSGPFLDPTVTVQGKEAGGISQGRGALK